MPVAQRNDVLDRLLTTGRISLDGESSLTLRHPEFPDALSHVDIATGDLLQRVIRDIRPQRSLEIGLAYGISTLFICDALTVVSPDAQHVVIDPFQNGKWRGLGLRHVREAGFGRVIDFREAPSEIALPQLLATGNSFDFVFIDGLHRFDQVMMEFYYVNRLLRVGGVVAFDDANRRSVSRAIRHALTYPAYAVHDATVPPPARVSPLGAIRRRVAAARLARRLIRRDVLVRDWDLGIGGRCVALKKVSEDERHTYFDADF